MKSNSVWTPDAATVAWLRSKFTIDPETGRISRAATGELADTTFRLDGYRCVHVHNPALGIAKPKKISAHRLAWILYYGEPAPSMLDHVDHDPANNAKANLRLATNATNQWNRRPSPTHKGKPRHSSFKGVTKVICRGKWYGKWRAQISRGDGVPMCVGLYDTELEAARAYNDAARERFGEWALLNELPESA